AQALNTLSQIELSGHQAILQASTAAQANVRTEAAQANTAMDQAKTHVFASGDKSVARLREEIKDREGVDAKMIIGRLKHGYKVAENRASSSAREAGGMLTSGAHASAGGFASIAGASGSQAHGAA